MFHAVALSHLQEKAAYVEECTSLLTFIADYRVHSPFFGITTGVCFSCLVYVWNAWAHWPQGLLFHSTCDLIPPPLKVRSRVRVTTPVTHMFSL